jgi:hypothetical protein
LKAHKKSIAKYFRTIGTIHHQSWCVGPELTPFETADVVCVKIFDGHFDRLASGDGESDGTDSWNQLTIIVETVLAMTGRVTMLGLCPAGPKRAGAIGWCSVFLVKRSSGQSCAGNSSSSI